MPKSHGKLLERDPPVLAPTLPTRSTPASAAREIGLDPKSWTLWVSPVPMPPPRRTTVRATVAAVLTLVAPADLSNGFLLSAGCLAAQAATS